MAFDWSSVERKEGGHEGWVTVREKDVVTERRVVGVRGCSSSWRKNGFGRRWSGCRRGREEGEGRG